MDKMELLVKQGKILAKKEALLTFYEYYKTKIPELWDMINKELNIYDREFNEINDKLKELENGNS